MAIENNKPTVIASEERAKQSLPLVPKLRFKEFEGEWEKYKVGELCDCIVPGRNKPKKFEGNIAWITTPDIEHSSYIYYSKSGLGISKEEAKNVGSKIVPKDSVIISCVGDLGLVAIAGVELVINQQLHAFLPSQKVDHRFIMYSICTQAKHIDKVATKTAVPYMNKDNCNSIPIYKASIKEQQKIANFLTAVDTKIQQLNTKKEHLEQYKKGVMQQLFSQQLRFKDENGEAFADWEEKKLGEVCASIKSGKSKSSDNGSFPLYGSTGIIGKCDDFSHNGFFILIARVGANAGTINVVDDKFGVSDNTLVVICDDNTYSKFIYFFLDFYNLNRLIFGSGQPLITGGQLKSLKFNVPCFEEQQKIANYLSAIDLKIEAVNTQISNTQAFKKGLLQQLFV
ncbi:restriction endonuclease subunit S [Lacinutrix undariae]